MPETLNLRPDKIEIEQMREIARQGHPFWMGQPLMWHDHGPRNPIHLPFNVTIMVPCWHRWRHVGRKGAWIYQNCFCGARRCRKEIGLLGPIDIDWLTGADWYHR